MLPAVGAGYLVDCFPLWDSDIPKKSAIWTFSTGHMRRLFDLGQFRGSQGHVKGLSFKLAL